MQIENEFTVAAPAERLWSYLLDVERVAPCLPGAELTETVDDHTWKGRVNMKLGPVSLTFAGTVTMQERDDDAFKVALRANGMEQKGKGAANASVTSWLEPGASGTTVKMVADVQLTGAVAQLSRGLLPEVSRKLTQQFADCLRERMVGEERPEGDLPETGPAPRGPASSPAARAKPISGIRLGLSAIWSQIAGFFARLLGTRRA